MNSIKPIASSMNSTSTREILIEKYIPPTEIDRDGDEIWRNKHSLIHSINGQPAQIKYFNNGQVRVKFWAKNGVKHREKNMPSEIGYINGRITYKCWYKNGKYIAGRGF